MFKELTHSKAVDNSANEHLWKLKGRNLEDSSDCVRSQAENDCFLSAQFVPESKGKDCPEECTKLRTQSIYKPEKIFTDIPKSNLM